jgi:hypothetical protein
MIELIDEYCVFSYFYIRSLMHFDNNGKKMEVYKYILVHH